ncbi:MAG: hypothetical protein R3335_04795, partial [Anaerolineales bacterium]|nr:hypothetical protein [Anaerolineales bacterium]
GESAAGNPTSSSEGSLEWVHIRDIASRQLVEDLYVLLPYLLEQPFDAPPFSAHYSYDADDQLVISFAAS